MATIDMDRKEGAAVLLSWGELGPRLIQCGLSRGLLPYQVASSSIQPFVHNKHGPKIRWVEAVPFFWGAGSLSNTKSSGPRPTFTASGILVHPAVYRHNEHGPKIGEGLCPLREGELGPHLTQCRLGGGLPPNKVIS